MNEEAAEKNAQIPNCVVIDFLELRRLFLYYKRIKGRGMNIFSVESVVEVVDFAVHIDGNHDRQQHDGSPKVIFSFILRK